MEPANLRLLISPSAHVHDAGSHALIYKRPDAHGPRISLKAPEAEVYQLMSPLTFIAIEAAVASRARAAGGL